MNYYNEFDKFAANWLWELIKAGLIPAGHVDDRSIKDVQPGDLRGFTQCHFFAGIGGWPLALQLAGWPADRVVWTGSCPCQPFSAAGKGAGFSDDRHLWPEFQRLIAECKPADIFGEQVASKATDQWFDLVQHDLEALGYAFGCIPFPAAGVGAPHIRDRAYWVANSLSSRQPGTSGGGIAQEERVTECREPCGLDAQRGGAVRLADATSEQCDPRRLRTEGEQSSQVQRSSRHGAITGSAEIESGIAATGSGGWPSPLHGFWRNADWLLCRDGKWRPVEPGTFPLAYGVPARVGKLRGYGNAIVVPQAAEFISAFMDVQRDLARKHQINQSGQAVVSVAGEITIQGVTLQSNTIYTNVELRK